MTKKRKHNQRQPGRRDTKTNRDSITGLSMVVDGTTLYFDKTYVNSDEETITLTRRNSELSGGDPDLAEERLRDRSLLFSFEWEISDAMMVFTSASHENGSSFYQRAIYEGEFRMKRGRLKSANIKGEASHTATFADGRLTYQSAAIYRVKAPFKVKEVSNTSSWDEALRKLWGNDEHLIYEAQFANEKSDIWQFGDMSQINNYGGGGLLQEGWWDNPFATNLI